MSSKNLTMSSLLDIYGGLLTEKQRSFLDYYYNDDLSLAEIAENENITRQGVFDVIKRASDQLNNFEKKLRLNERFDSISVEADKILKGEEANKCAESIKRIINFEEV